METEMATNKDLVKTQPITKEKEHTGDSSVQCEKSFDVSRISNLSCPARQFPTNTNKPDIVITPFDTKTTKSDNIQNNKPHIRKNRNKKGVIKDDQISDKSNNPQSLISLHRITAPHKYFNNNRSTWVLDSDFTVNKFDPEHDPKKLIGPKSLRHFILKIFSIISAQVLINGLMITMCYSQYKYRYFLESNPWA